MFILLFRQRSRRRKIIFFSIYGLISISLIVIIILSCIGFFCPEFKLVSPNYQRCESDDCKFQANRLFNNGKFYKDPCNEFDQFTCGKFVASRELVYSSLQTDEKRKLTSRINEILDSELRKINENDLHSISYIKMAYDECTKEKISEYDHLKKLYNEMMLPATHEEKLSVISSYGESVIIDVDVKSDPYDSSKKILWLGPPDFGIDGQILVNADDKIDNHSMKVKNFYSIFLNDTMKELDKTGDNIYNEILYGIQFETELARAAIINDIKLKLPEELYRKMKIFDLQKEISEIHINTFLNSISNNVGSKITFNDDTNIIVNNLPYFINLNSILKKYKYGSHDRPQSPFLTYLRLRLVKSFAYLVDSDSSELEGIKHLNQFNDVNLTNRCINVLRNNAQMILGKLYIDTNPVTKRDIDNVTTIVKTIISTFKETIIKNNWISDDDKKILLEKIDTIKLHLGYPEWINDKRKLETLIDLGKPESNDHAVELISKLQKVTLRNKINSLQSGQVDEVDKWHFSPASVDLFYDLTSNSLTIPAGIMHPIYFNSNVTSYLNYPAIGVEVAANLLKGFSLNGLHYNKDGNLKSDLSEEFASKLDEKVTCYKKKYSSLKYEEKDLFNIAIDGEKNLDLNIADNEALKLAHLAFKNSSFIKDIKLPVTLFDKFTDDQLFYISYGSSRCHDLNNYVLYAQLTSSSTPAPLKDRTRMSLSNYENFVKSFNCRKESKYILQGDFCSIWL